MKKLTIILALVISAFAFSQAENSSIERKNDIMINPFVLLAGGIGFSYERVLNQDAGIGAATILVFDGSDSESTTSQFTAFYRYYLGKKNNATGFFVGPLIGFTDYRYYPLFSNELKHESLFGIGFNFGGKWYAKKNLLFEASLGFGRNLGSSSENDYPILSTGMLGIGYRF